jgi:hypothetical protein
VRALLIAGAIATLLAQTLLAASFAQPAPEHNQAFLPIVVQSASAPSPPEPQPPERFRSLARRVLSSTSDDDARDAVADVFLMAGVDVIGADESERHGLSPSIPVRVHLVQLDAYAADARLRGAGSWRMTLQELGSALQQLQWGVPAERDSGAVLADVLGQAIRKAHQEPASPHSAVPLFLHAVSLAANDRTSLFSGKADPNAIRLSGLEVQLLLLAHLRASVSYTLPPAAPAAAVLSSPGASAQADSVCGTFEDKEGELDAVRLLKAAALVIIDKVTDVPFDTFYEALGITSGAGKFAIAKVLNIVNILFTTRAISLRLTSDYSERHYSHVSDAQAAFDRDRRGSGWNNVAFTAAASSLNPYERFPELYACLKTLGLFAPEDIVALLKEARVRWFANGLMPHARVGTVGVKNPPFEFNTVLSYVLGEDGESRLVVDMNHEPGGPYPDGIARSGEATLRAELDTSQMPPLSDLIQAVIPGELPDVILAILLEWSKKWLAPEAEARVTAVWHEPRCANQRAERADVCKQGEWRGSVTMSKTSESHTAQSWPINGGVARREIGDTRVETQRWFITGNHLMAWQADHSHEYYNEAYTTGHIVNGPINCRGYYQSTSIDRTVESGNASLTEMPFTVILRPDETYWINNSFVGEIPPVTVSGAATHYFVSKGPCGVGPETSMRETGGQVSHYRLFTLTGSLDPSDRNRIVGSKTTRTVGSDGVTTTETWNWEFVRVP